MIKAIIFDLGNVVLHFDHFRSCEKLAQLSSYTKEEIYDYIFKAHLEKLYDEGRISSQQFFDKLKRYLELKISFVEFSEIWGNIFWENKGIKSIIKSLKKRFKIVLLSNTNEIHFIYARKNFHILDEFDDYILSYRIGVRKPSKEIFVYAVESLNFPSNSIIYIDDSQEFVNVARSVGINGIVFNTPEQLKNEISRVCQDTIFK